MPPLLWVLHRWLRRRIAVALGCLALVSFSFSVTLLDTDQSLVFFMLPFRAWELLLGSLLAIVPLAPFSRPGAAAVAGLGGVALIAGAVGLYDASTPFPGWTAIPPCVGTALIIHAGRLPGALSARFLGWSPLVFIGKTSYSLYLWHWPLIVYSRILLDVDGPEWSAGVALLSIAVGASSWRLVEEPFRRGGQGSRWKVFSGAAIVSGAWVVFGLALHITGGAPGRLDPATRAFASAADDFEPSAKSCGDWSGPRGIGEGLCVIGDNTKLPPSFLLWGDSHAAILVHGVDAAARSQSVAGIVIDEMSCPPLFGVEKDDSVVDDRLDTRCVEGTERARVLVESTPSIKDVILVARWPYYFRGGGVGRDADHLIEVRWREGSNEDVMAAALRQTVSRLRELGKRVWLVGPIPEMPDFDARAGANHHLLGRETRVAEAARVPLELVLERARPFLEVAGPTAESDDGVRVLDPNRYFCDREQCSAIGRDGVPRYFDNNHVTTRQSESLEPFWTPVLRAQSEK